MLIREGVSSRLVLDGEPDSQRHIDLCRGREPFEVICLRPDPDNTRAEAQAAGRLARDRGWDRVVVVTSTQHVARARLVFDRCIGGTVQMVAAAPPFSLGERVTQVMREWPKWAYTAVLSREC